MKNSISMQVRSGARSAGFTLIELLTVIAIISILAGMTAVAVPRYLEKAQVTKAESNLAQIAQGLSSYAAQTGNTVGFPAGYGFVKQESRDVAPATLLAAADQHYQLRPYTIEIGIHQDVNVYELPRWTRNAYDSNNNGTIGLLEYCPVGEKSAVDNNYAFSIEMYTGSNNPQIVSLYEITEQTKNGVQRPFVYVPYNSRQLATVSRYWLRNGLNYGEEFDSSDPDLTGRMFFPPPQYDGFVLIGNGPGGNNGGVAADPPTKTGTGYEDAYIYHVTALRAAFLATRDLDPDGAGPLQADGKPDFDFRTRRTASDVFLLPDGTNGQGAMIKKID